jgi:hypothetical protein
VPDRVRQRRLRDKLRRHEEARRASLRAKKERGNGKCRSRQQRATPALRSSWISPPRASPSNIPRRSSSRMRPKQCSIPSDISPKHSLRGTARAWSTGAGHHNGCGVKKKRESSPWRYSPLNFACTLPCDISVKQNPSDISPKHSLGGEKQCGGAGSAITCSGFIRYYPPTPHPTPHPHPC